jgi:hypothetical protein
MKKENFDFSTIVIKTPKIKLAALLGGCEKKVKFKRQKSDISRLEL